MAKNLQKTADFYRKKVGIINPADFARHVRIQFFEPLPELAPLVAHYFVARWDVPPGADYTAANALSQPAVHLVFTPSESFIAGVTTPKLLLHLKGSGVYAGARFKPGGFYPFWHQTTSELTEKTVPAVAAFPQATPAFVKNLLSHDDPAIADRIESLLLAKHPKTNHKIKLVQDIVSFIETNAHINTAAAVAQKFALSERTLQQLFTTYVGAGVKWVIMRKRFLEALEQAHAPQKPDWTTIAAELGYSTQSHFVHDFKKVMGQSPTQYVKTITRRLYPHDK